MGKNGCTRRGVNDNLLPRTITPTLEEILRIMPAVGRDWGASDWQERACSGAGSWQPTISVVRRF